MATAIASIVSRNRSAIRGIMFAFVLAAVAAVTLAVAAPHFAAAAAERVAPAVQGKVSLVSQVAAGEGSGGAFSGDTASGAFSGK